jgi:glycosyltransferase involved in cell wall biosynthesis
MKEIIELRINSISFCSIVKNESENIARCLESVKPYVDELIIVDTGSDDNTVEIAHQYGAKVFYFQWCDDFAAAKNYAMSQATSNWILFLDADEELITKIDNISFKNILSQSDALIFNICRKDIDSFQLIPVKLQRIFRNLDTIKYVGAYHEQLYYNSQNISSNQIQDFDSLEILHYGYSQKSLETKANLRIKLLENILREKINLNIILTLEAMYEVTKQIDKVEECYEKVYEFLLPHLLSGEALPDYRAVSSWLLRLGIKFINDKDYENAILIVERGLKWSPDFPPFYYLSAEILMALGFYLGAIPYYEVCLKFHQEGKYNNTEPFNLHYLSTYPAYRIGCAYAELENWNIAQEYITLSLDFDPDYTPAKKTLDRIIQICN